MGCHLRRGVASHRRHPSCPKDSTPLKTALPGGWGGMARQATLSGEAARPPPAHTPPLAPRRGGAQGRGRWCEPVRGCVSSGAREATGATFHLPPPQPLDVTRDPGRGSRKNCADPPREGPTRAGADRCRVTARGLVAVVGGRVGGSGCPPCCAIPAEPWAAMTRATLSSVPTPIPRCPPRRGEAGKQRGCHTVCPKRSFVGLCVGVVGGQ